MTQGIIRSGGIRMMWMMKRDIMIPSKQSSLSWECVRDGHIYCSCCFGCVCRETCGFADLGSAGLL